MGLASRLRVLGPQLLVVAVAIAIWYWASRGGRVSPILLPKPEMVAERLPELLTAPITWVHVRLTLMEIVVAFGLSASTGLMVGFVSGRSAYTASLIEPILTWLQTVPIILIYPICVLLFGLGPASKIIFAGIYGFFPIAYTTSRALATVDERYIRAARSLGASERQLVRHVKLRAALPLIISGIRIGAALNLIGVLAGEILASSAGLGYQIAASGATFKTADLYSYIIVALILIAIFNTLVTKTEDRYEVA